MTIQLASSDDLFVWPCGTQCTRDEFERGCTSHLSDDFEVVPVGSQRWQHLTDESLETTEAEARSL